MKFVPAPQPVGISSACIDIWLAQSCLALRGIAQSRRLLADKVAEHRAYDAVATFRYQCLHVADSCHYTLTPAGFIHDR